MRRRMWPWVRGGVVRAAVRRVVRRVVRAVMRRVVRPVVRPVVLGGVPGWPPRRQLCKGSARSQPRVPCSLAAMCCIACDGSLQWSEVDSCPRSLETCDGLLANRYARQAAQHATGAGRNMVRAQPHKMLQSGQGPAGRSLLISDAEQRRGPSAHCSGACGRVSPAWARGPSGRLSRRHGQCTCVSARKDQGMTGPPHPDVR